VKRHAALVPLSREHNTALVLALRINREVPRADAEGVREIYETLISFWARGLLPHFRAENECLLARLVRQVPENDELISRTQLDHLRIEALVADMRDSADTDARRKLLLAFAERLRAHIRWEEDSLFRATQEKLTDGELRALGADVAERVGDGNARLD
jgi:hemerythrin-like domain-containing protein